MKFFTRRLIDQLIGITNMCAHRILTSTTISMMVTMLLQVMPDGEQHLRCYRKQCPSLVDCPKNNILLSGPDSCCPYCARQSTRTEAWKRISFYCLTCCKTFAWIFPEPLSNCTTALIGNEVLATDDPCFTCQCKVLPHLSFYFILRDTIIEKKCKTKSAETYYRTV